MKSRTSPRQASKSGSHRQLLGVLGYASLSAGAIAAPQGGGTGDPITFSIGWHGPTVGQGGFSGGPPITEGDILRPAFQVPNYGPLPNPFVLFTGSQLGLQRYSACVGHPGGTPCGIEIDGISYGVDHELKFDTNFQVWFVVDSFAQGHPPFFGGPNVQTEGGSIGDLSSDVLVDLGLQPGPLSPMGPVVGHVAAFDGDGLRSLSGYIYRGLGTVEPNPPTFGQAHPGDSIDAFDIGPVPSAGTGRVFLTLDSAFIDPRTGVSNSGSAAFAGFSPADVLSVDVGGSPLQLYAPAALLGLDASGVGTDDVDSLILAENGVPGFQRSRLPYDWLPSTSAGAESDMLLFSVRAGSAVIGRPDSIFGMPIEPGDLLIPPIDGGVSSFPGIFFPAEAMGLATSRTDGAPVGDDMSGADITPRDEAYHDCNGNDRDDAIDIAVGFSNDNNQNGIPDECEPIGMRYCFCSAGPCANSDAAAGCANSTGVGASLEAIGSTSVTVDDLQLVSAPLPTNKPGIFYMGGAQVQFAFGDGQRCVSAGSSGLYRFPVQFSSSTGTMTLGPGIVDLSCSIFSGAGCILTGSSWNLQNWYRDPMGPCGSAFNLSNGLAVTFTP